MAVNESNFDKIDNFKDRLVRFDNQWIFLVRKLHKLYKIECDKN
jgi:hypothetical protein